MVAVSGDGEKSILRRRIYLRIESRTFVTGLDMRYEEKRGKRIFPGFCPEQQRG